MIHVVSVRVGTKYGPEYVAILHDMIGRNLSNAEGVVHWCLTDDPDSLPEGITPIRYNKILPGWWQKVYLFSPKMPWGVGDRILYCDLDVVVTGRLEDLAERKGIIKDWHWPGFNSSVMVWDHGEHFAIWRDFHTSRITAPGKIVPPEVLPKGQVNGGDQEHITVCAPDWPTFPPEWCVTYKDAQTWPPNDCKVVVFHGENAKPHLTAPDSWVRNIWKVGGFTSLPAMKGMNVTHDRALENVRANIERDLEWFTGFPEQKGTLVLVCGGPSMKDNIAEIRAHKQRGAKICTVNNALRYLLDQGLKPDHHVILDARPENVEFLKDAPLGVRYFLASQCDPILFDALKGRDVILWHNGIGDGAELEEIAQGRDKPVVVVPGGCTVGLRALWLAFGSGYRKLHVYGMDSSYHDDAHHAYPQALNDDEETIWIALGEGRYRCAKWMARQASDFQKSYPELRAAGMKIWVHGRGLIPDLWRALKAQEEA